MAWITPITDRTLTDVLNRTAKGFFNILDWSRIYGNAEYVHTLIEVLKSINVDYPALSTPTIATIPQAADINDFLEGLETLRIASTLANTDLVVLKTDYTSGESEDTPDYADVNTWENNLLILRNFLINSSGYEVFCGVAEAGQIRFWQNRFRTPFIQPTAPNVRRVRCGVAICGTGLTRQNGMRGY